MKLNVNYMISRGSHLQCTQVWSQIEPCTFRRCIVTPNFRILHAWYQYYSDVRILWPLCR